MGGKMAVILYRPSSTSSHFTRHLLIRKHSRYISDRAYGIDTYIQSTYDSSSMPILEDRANRSGSEGSTVRVHDSFSCSSGDDARCAKSEFSNDSGDDPGCGDGSDDYYGESRDNGDYVEIGGWSLCVYIVIGWLFVDSWLCPFEEMWNIEWRVSECKEDGVN